VKIEFIIPTYNRPNELMMTISCITSQIVPDFSIHVIADAPYEGLDKIKNYFEGDDRIRFTTLNGPHNDWGHTPRIYGIENAKEDWIVMTGDDNYYFPTFIAECSRAYEMYPTANFIFCNMYHNYSNYVYQECKPQIGCIDIGAFTCRTEMARKIPFKKELHHADGTFVEEYVSTFCKETGTILKINNGLYVHN